MAAASNIRPDEQRAQLLQAIETAIIVSREIGMSPEGIKACLIAPFCTNPAQIDDLRRTMGDRIATILDGIISVQQLYQRNTSIQTDNFRNLLVSFAKDMRVILLMIASCTNIMRKMSDICSQDKEKHEADTTPEYSHEFMERMAGEASFLYAPLAHKLGL